MTELMVQDRPAYLHSFSSTEDLYEHILPGGFPRYVDDSLLKDFASCEHSMLLRYIYYWRTLHESDHLIFGGAYASGLEAARRAFYQEGDDQFGAIASGVAAGLKHYGLHHHIDDRKSGTRLAEAIVFYGNRYPFATDEFKPVARKNGTPWIEFSWAVPLPIEHPVTNEPLIYVGRSDAVMENPHGLLYLFDDKTTTQLGQSWASQWELNSQFSGYTWAAWQQGVDVCGTVVRGLCSYVDRLDMAQAIVYRPKHLITKWYDNTLSRLQRLRLVWLRMLATGQTFDYNFGTTCTSYGGCPFREICAAEDEDKWLNVNFKRRLWDPVTRAVIELPSSLQPKMGQLSTNSQ